MANQDLNARELELSYFVTTRRLLLRKILLGTLGFLIFLFYGITIVGVVRLFFIDYDSYRRMMLELPLDLVNYQGFRETDSPKPFQVLSTTVIPVAQQQKYDIIVRISNPNPKWFATFDYQFLAEGLKSQPRQAFILPGEEKYLVDLASMSSKPVRQPIFDIKNLKWHKFLEYENFKKTHLEFKVEDLKFTPASTSEISGKVPVSKTTFNLRNFTAYNFWKVGVYVVLYSGSRVAGANFVTLEQIKSGDVVPVEINWFESLPGITKVDVMPEVNILSSSSYMQFEGGTREEFRSLPPPTF